MGTYNLLKGSTVLSVITIIYCVYQVDANLLSKFHLIGYNSPWKIFKYEHDKFTPIPVVDVKNDKLTFVTGSIMPSFRVIIDDFDDPTAKCDIKLNLQYNSISDRSAVNLGNGKIITSLKNNLVSRLDPSLAAYNVDWKLLIVELTGGIDVCSNETLTIGNEETHLIQILPYEYTFDILMETTFLKVGERHLILEGPIQVIRSNDNGNLTKNFAKITDRVISKIVLAKKYDPAQGYYYITCPYGEKSVIKKLDSNYQVVNTYEFVHSKYNRFDKNAFSADYEQFSVCYYVEGDKGENLKCLILNGDLTRKIIEVTLIFERYVEHITVNNFVDGTVIVVYAMGKPNSREYLIFAQLVNKKGKIDDPVELGKSSDVISEINSFEMKDGSYCITVTTDEHIMTKCLSLPK